MDKKRILLVEDSDYRELVAFLLKRSGYDVAETTTGLAALEQANATRSDLIIMDLGLPGIMGDEATARLKADSSRQEIPVIVCTAFRRVHLWSALSPLVPPRFYTSPFSSRIFWMLYAGIYIQL